MNYKRSSKLLNQKKRKERCIYEKETRFEYSVLTISVKGVEQEDSVSQARFIELIFEIAA
ncbi:MAG TPA: hypothetical protein V6C65_24630 [Allocoleopsis sp.]